MTSRMIRLNFSDRLSSLVKAKVEYRKSLDLSVSGSKTLQASESRTKNLIVATDGQSVALVEASYSTSEEQSAYSKAPAD